MISYRDIDQIRLEHRIEIVNQLLYEGWVLLCEPYTGLRRIQATDDSSRLIDIPWREFVLGRKKNRSN